MKAGIYDKLVTEVRAVLDGESDLTANMANVAALIKSAFNPWWVGFYLVKNNELVLGPFQGPVACTRIAFGKGVCGSSWKQASTIIVPDVHQFPGHIACSAASNSEIVVPLIHNGAVWAVLDIDSTEFSAFDEEDKTRLEELVQYIVKPDVISIL